MFDVLVTFPRDQLTLKQLGIFLLLAILFSNIFPHNYTISG